MLNERASVIVTANLGFSEWATVFSRTKIATALLNRLTHRCRILETGNDNFRFKSTSAKAAYPAKDKSSELDERLTPKTSSGRVSSRWKSRVNLRGNRHPKNFISIRRSLKKCPVSL